MSTTTPNMNLTVPTVSTTPGPTYAVEINTSLSVIDTHDHTTGKGVQITPVGLNINSDLTFGVNNAVSVRTVRFAAQSSPLAGTSDVGCLYESGVDLYYNDGSGNQVRMTSGGGVSGTPGSITNLAAPATASYVSGTQTFVFQSDANIPANIDGGSVVLRNITLNSNGLTLAPPAGMSSNSTITLPAIPASTSFLTINTSGDISASPSTTAGITGAMIAARTVAASNIVGSTITFAEISNRTIIGSNIATSTITRTNLAALGQSMLISSVNMSVPPATVIMSQSLTSSGRPIMCMLYGTTDHAYVRAAQGGVSPNFGFIQMRQNGAQIGGSMVTGSGASNHLFTGNGFSIVTLALTSGGTQTFDLAINSSASANNVILSEMAFTVFEL